MLGMADINVAFQNSPFYNYDFLMEHPMYVQTQPCNKSVKAPSTHTLVPFEQECFSFSAIIMQFHHSNQVHITHSYMCVW